MADLKELYERDFLAWSEQQTKALRRAAQTRSNQLFDWENLAEEIEGLGISQKSALGSQVIARMRAVAYTEEQVLGDWFPEERR